MLSLLVLCLLQRTYITTVRIPFLGRQDIAISLAPGFPRANAVATLTMAGAFDIEESIVGNGTHFRAGPNVQTLLARARTSLTEATYDRRRDAFLIEIKPPLVKPVRVELSRKSRP